jgi:hypothetical protein
MACMVRRRSTVRFRNGAPQKFTCEARSEAHWTVLSYAADGSCSHVGRNLGDRLLSCRQGGPDEAARGLASGVLAGVVRKALDDVPVPPWGPGEEAGAELPPVGGQAAGSPGVTGRVPCGGPGEHTPCLCWQREWNRLSAKALADLSRSTGPCGEPPSRERTRGLGDLIVGPLHEPVAKAAVRDRNPPACGVPAGRPPVW